ncbi:hypothetical protein SFRURICE_005824 [Spodoptera frugiperda]|uniref:SFRICE_023106 n=1 Tax=Spodoptera frugiperda TaxID=7108 RepID=A0A2H1X2H1_SPOFR|nr:hypothetical protein SFRURICE_005824 [Spodoptera frugiperda]
MIRKFQAMLEAHIHEQHSATHDAAIVALLLAFLVKQLQPASIKINKKPKYKRDYLKTPQSIGI